MTTQPEPLEAVLETTATSHITIEPSDHIILMVDPLHRDDAPGPTTANGSAGAAPRDATARYKGAKAGIRMTPTGQLDPTRTHEVRPLEDDTR